MADRSERADVVAEMSLLRKLQLRSLEEAAFGGWSDESKAEYDRRADRLSLLVHRLAELGEKR